MFDLEISVKVASRLWEFFIPSIRSGYQIYFCFSRDMIRSSLGDLFTGDPVEEFFDLVSNFYIPINDHCELDQSVFEAKVGNHSLAILLVAQQILVVEDMVNEGGITEEAYFPRLRRRISKSLSESSVMPLSAEDFLKIWKTFRDEVIRAGAKETSITFYAGLGSNKHRSYPMSQALLSTQDLITLASKIPKEIHISKISDESVFEVSKKIRNSLSARGRRVFTVSWLRQRVIGQIRSFFSANRDLSKTANEREFHIVHREEIELRVYSDELFGDVKFELSGVLKNSLQQANNSDVFNYLRNKLERNSEIFLCLESTKSHWTDNIFDVELDADEVLVILTNDKNNIKLKVTLERYWPKSSVSLNRIEVGQDCVAYEFRVPGPPVIPCMVRNGLIVEKNVRGSYSWKNGVCLDERSNLFLLGYPPDVLCLDGTPLPPRTEVKLGDRTVPLGRFLEEIKIISKDHDFQIEVNSRVLKLSLIEKRLPHSGFRKYGYPFDGKTFAPVAEEVFTDPAIIGFFSKDIVFRNESLTRTEVVEFLRLQFADWEPLNEVEINQVSVSVESTRIPRAVKRLILKSMRERRACPSALRRKLQEAS